MSLLKSIHRALVSAKDIHLCLVLIVLGFLVFQNAIFHPFVHDDNYFIVNNPNISQINIGQILSGKAFNGFGDVHVNTYYRPLLEFVYRILYLCFGLNASAYHFVNILVHIANAVLLYVLCQKMFNWHRLLSMAVALIFLIHPVQVEAVACISGISNTLYVFWSSLSLIAYFQIYNSTQRMRVFYLLGAVGLFSLALLTKEQAIVIPVLIIAYEMIVRRKDSSRQYWPVISGLFFLMIGGYFMLRHVMIGQALATEFNFDYEMKLRILAIAKTLLMYLKILFWPEGLHYYRSIDILGANLWHWVGILGIVLLGVFIYRQLRENVRRIYLFGAAWFIITLALVLNIIPLINEYTIILTAEHFLYWPIVGISLMLLAAFDDLVTRRLTVDYDPSLTGMFIVIIMVFSFLTMKQNKIWANETVLFKNTVSHQPNFGRARLLFGNALYNEGEFTKGIVQYQKASEIMQGYYGKVTLRSAKNFYANYIVEANLALASGYEKIGGDVTARPYYEEAIKLQEPNALVYNFYALNFLRAGETLNAIEKFKLALEKDPKNLFIMNSLAICYKQVGKFNEAKELFEYIALHDPQSVSAKQNLELIKQQLTVPQI